MSNKIIIDVRTKEEFIQGNIKGSINIPLQQIEFEIDKIKTMGEPIHLCCASGNRSGIATQLLKSHNIDCQNIGSWANHI
jgi:phage shock protein E